MDDSDSERRTDIEELRRKAAELVEQLDDAQCKELLDFITAKIKSKDFEVTR